VQALVADACHTDNVYRKTYSDQVKSQFLSCRLLLFELGPYPGDGGDVIVIEGIDEIFLH
jgi:hypothetical protein